MIKYFLFIFFALIPVTAKANPGDMPAEQQMAIQYIQAITDHDYRTLASFYNRDSVFVDRTASKEYKGRRDILEFFERAHRGVLEYDFNIEHMYNSGSLVVMIGNYHYRGPGSLFGKPGKVIELAIPGVTTVQLDLANHRVKEHEDLMDYQTMQDQLATQ
ncbi:nuclear transport factor 2 family protein [Shewanella sp. Isolate11]|uniref:nuclear transport factor 2 family protein n=1 Tax=Shewanella sp. Isolate11 TaxID=2908530 RepID=UPI001EFE7999|nr:nuclear transport factor 2 family protein [Shewanella sp. Isolate11]MCG9695912.1 nuclear transport factor 2 family protein [Shewanella sp. Isolate11]